MNEKLILVVDDDTRLRELLTEFLVAEGYHVDAAENAGIAREKLKEKQYDLLIVDVMMPGEDGVQLTQSIRLEQPVPILMLTAMGEVADRIKGLESGADDYLVKPFEPRELLLRIENILRRTPPARSKELTFGDFRFDASTGELTQAGVAVFLTSTEIKLLEILCEQIGQPISRENLSKRLNGISERSVDVQITRLRKKLESDPRQPKYLQSVWGQGYVLRPKSA
jgi:two-component system phosphate regulon response regulator OmpR